MQTIQYALIDHSYALYCSLVDFLAHGRLSEDCIKAREVHYIATRHVLVGGILFCWELDDVL